MVRNLTNHILQKWLIEEPGATLKTQTKALRALYTRKATEIPGAFLIYSKIHFFGKKILSGHGAYRGSFSKLIAGSTYFWLIVNTYFQITLGSVESSGNASRPATSARSQESYESRWAELYSSRFPLTLRRINRCNARSATVSSTSFHVPFNVFFIPSKNLEPHLKNFCLNVMKIV